MMSYIFFFGGLLLLYVLSRLLTRTLTLLLYQKTGSSKATIYGIAFLFFPGVVIHELSHFFAAVITRVPASRIEFFPKVIDGRLKLGSVQIQKTDPLRKTIIAIAPVIGGCFVILGSIWLVRTYFIDSYFAIGLLILFIYQVSNTMFSSKKDLEGTGIFLVFLLVLVGVLWIAEVPVVHFLTASEIGISLQMLLDRAFWYLRIAIGIDIAVLVFLLCLRYMKRG